MAAELSWPQVHAYRLAAHHLLERGPRKDLTRVVGAMGGAQAQVMSAAELQIGVRVDAGVEDVRKALWKEKSLAKTWLMRGTLHLVPAADLPLYTAAMRTRWIKTSGAWLKYVQLTEPELMEVMEAIGEALDGEPLTREELIARVGRGRSERVRVGLSSGWGGLLKPAARHGLLCFGPSRGQSVTFVRPERWLSAWRELDPDGALVEIARRYLRAYGPATRDDFASWWGRWPGVGKAAWAGLAEDLVPVSVEGRRAEMLRSEMRRLSGVTTRPSVVMLPAFDPYLMGHNSRDHLFDVAYRWKVSRVAGWISPVVLVDGSVVATWTHEVVKRALHVKVEPFRKLPPRVMPQLRERAGAVAATLGLDGAVVKIA